MKIYEEQIIYNTVHLLYIYFFFVFLSVSFGAPELIFLFPVPFLTLLTARRILLFPISGLPGP